MRSRKCLQAEQNCSVITKTSLCYLHCFGHKPKTYHHLSCYKENNSIPVKTSIVSNFNYPATVQSSRKLSLPNHSVAWECCLNNLRCLIKYKNNFRLPLQVTHCSTHENIINVLTVEYWEIQVPTGNIKKLLGCKCKSMDSNTLVFLPHIQLFHTYYASSLEMISFSTELSISQSKKAIKVKGHCGFRISMYFAKKNDLELELDVPQEERVWPVSEEFKPFCSVGMSAGFLPTGKMETYVYLGHVPCH